MSGISDEFRRRVQRYIDDCLSAENASNQKKLDELHAQEPGMVAAFTPEQLYEYNLMVLTPHIIAQSRDELDQELQMMCGSNDLEAKFDYLQRYIMPTLVANDVEDALEKDRSSSYFKGPTGLQ